jgi:3D (Asp-Asp-Asp) domain-containing protein
MKVLLYLFLVMGNGNSPTKISTQVTATIYHATPEQTNADYLTTASMKKIDSTNPRKHQWIAVSRDLEKLGFVFGQKVHIENAGELNGIWTIEDRMNKRFTKRIDFLVNKTRKYGKWEEVKITLL